MAERDTPGAGERTAVPLVEHGTFRYRQEAGNRIRAIKHNERLITALTGLHYMRQRAQIGVIAAAHIGQIKQHAVTS